MKRMPRILAAALAVVLVLSAAGCGKKEPDLKSALIPVQTNPAAPALPTINPAAPAEEPTEAPTEEAFAGTLVETDYFRFSYTEEWQFDAEEDLEVSTRSVEAAVTLPDEDGESKLLRLTIEVKFNARPDYDLDLHLHNMDAREMMLNNAYETEQVGGMDFVVVEGYSSRTYMAYDDAANAYVNIYVSDERDDPRVAELLNTLRFTLPTSYEGEQTPWHWEGTPYTASGSAVTVGGFTVTGRLMPLSLSEPTYSKFNSRVAFDGTTLYVLHDGKVSTYAPEGDGFRYESDLELDFVPDEIFTDRSGILYLCANGRDVIARAQGMEYVAASRLKHVAVHPSGAMAISWGTTGDVTVVGLESGEQREMTFPGFKSVNHLFVTQNYVVINGPLEETGSMGLRIFDMQGNLVRQFTKEETTTGYFGSVSAVTETANGLVIVDGNMRDIYFADKQGNVLQSVDMPVLLGTGYPWPSSVITTQDGRILLCLTDERQDDSCTETLIFEIKGF